MDFTTTKNTRLGELDFLRAVMIILMISFHLVWIGDNYPYMKSIVYTFHMPVFLIISGYLTKLNGTFPSNIHRITWLAVPYLIMESLYILGASVLPVREHIENLNINTFLDKLLLHPIGPYWFLHTLILGSATLFLFSHLLKKLGNTTCLILAGIAFALYSKLGIASLEMLLYFLAGAAIRERGFNFVATFFPSWLSVIALLMLVVSPQNLHPHTAGGILIVFLTISFLLKLYPHIGGKFLRTFLFIGSNTLPIFLFSPLFTFICKPLQPILSFEPTGLLFLLASLTLCLAGSLTVAYILDKLHISPYIFGRNNVLIKKS